MNKSLGTSFDDFLKEENIYSQLDEAAKERVAELELAESKTMYAAFKNLSDNCAKVFQAIIKSFGLLVVIIGFTLLCLVLLW